MAANETPEVFELSDGISHEVYGGVQLRGTHDFLVGKFVMYSFGLEHQARLLLNNLSLS